MSDLHNEDYIVLDDNDMFNDSPDAQAIEEFEKTHLTEDELTFIKKTCMT